MEMIKVQRVEDKYARWVACEPVQDYRPTVSYRLCGTMNIEVGSRAMIIPVNHYNTSLVTNGHMVWTGTVLAHDATTGDFETARTRYVLDTGYEH